MSLARRIILRLLHLPRPARFCRETEGAAMVETIIIAPVILIFIAGILEFGAMLVSKIEIETGHLVQMVDELLDLSRIEAGRTLQMAEGVDMSRLAADSAERLRLFGERQGVTLRLETPAGLPSVRGDAARLGQVVVNLVHNAIKFSPDGGEVTIRTGVEDGHVKVSIEDHGIGIPRAAIDRIFERFYKVDRARLRAEAGGGTGLGLAIARHVVEQHGGRIWVESREGAGSTFAFTLPAADESRGTVGDDGYTRSASRHET